MVMNNQIEQLAIIGATASGKSSIAIDIAKKTNAIILSLDSLSIYKEIDIVSAKPTLEEREGVEHYGIDVIYPNEPFDVTIFADIYRECYQKALSNGQNLIIVGGTSFYLKVLIDGISPLPPIDEAISQKISDAMSNPKEVYRMLKDIDPQYMANISPSDSYRIEKALAIYLATQSSPSSYFDSHPPEPIISDSLAIYDIPTDRAVLRERISKRTKSMISNGLIDEVAYLEKRYTRSPNSMKAIGIKETLDYLDGLYTIKELEEKITTNTARLAKRQSTFNRSQFKDVRDISTI
ncbi:tRNA dimethylallyltransferase [hydrothermal vent metagenome]|uniref:tRNA dimethylallyltransferase n=1 Tax=hydrothermal vent metagenome TaxID=652676 RepID=A0A1W1BA85_9ZZZZ